MTSMTTDTQGRDHGRAAVTGRLRRRTRPTVRVAIAVLLLGGIFAVLAPRQIGGRTSYAVTDGVSMLPHFKAGDLVMLRAEPRYRIGQVAGYHNRELGVVVMHRIVARSGDRYVFKGDNNTRVDSYEPTASDMVGGAWVHLPRAGLYVNELRRPPVAAVLLGLLWLFSFGPGRRSGRRPTVAAGSEA